MYELSSVKAIFVYYLPWPLSQDALELQHIPSFSSASPTTVNIHMQGKKKVKQGLFKGLCFNVNRLDIITSYIQIWTVYINKSV